MWPSEAGIRKPWNLAIRFGMSGRKRTLYMNGRESWSEAAVIQRGGRKVSTTTRVELRPDQHRWRRLRRSPTNLHCGCC